MATNEAIEALSEKEKQTLRLIVRGHDAKSTARTLGLSVHTINERLREARRKMSVSSSREAARLLLEIERPDPSARPPNALGDSVFGEDLNRPDLKTGRTPTLGAGWRHRRTWILIGVPMMTLTLGLLALAAMPQTATTPTATTPTASSATAEPTHDRHVVDAARTWLELVDEGQWNESYQATGAAFRRINTAEVWAATSEKVRVPLGAVLSRTFISQQNLPAPPAGYEVVKFRTHYANKPDAVETVSLDREGGEWRIVGVMIE